MSAAVVQKQKPKAPLRRPPARVPSDDSGLTALQNPEATVAEIRDALLAEAGYPPAD